MPQNPPSHPLTHTTTHTHTHTHPPPLAQLRIGRYNQHFVDALSMDVNPVEYLLQKFPEAGLKGEGMRGMLGKVRG